MGTRCQAKGSRREEIDRVASTVKENKNVKQNFRNGFSKKFSALLQKNSEINMQPFSLKKSVAKKNQKKIATQNLLQKKIKNILQLKMVAKKNRKFFATEMLLQKISQKCLQQEFYKKAVAKINLMLPATG